jgi:hypothetical protein
MMSCLHGGCCTYSGISCDTSLLLARDCDEEDDVAGQTESIQSFFGTRAANNSSAVPHLPLESKKRARSSYFTKRKLKRCAAFQDLM